ncbi:PTS sugar transporter subunit IIA [Kocuria sp. cx-455]|uniref:PTS fructose transporter subunit IIABC n=1 Tax=Kocuria sp. cx-455 TaxID=2771377 RepID=UPI001689C1CC|nr:fructose-specific PTS transporter subunit EIIC [Kocuria sp. cx-455]MBD2765097.1 PTS sugar transporter subunit IIA [Kocuria sp. cx-455]
MSDLINPGLVLLDQDLGNTTEDVIRVLANTVHSEGRAENADALAADALAREAKNATGIPGGIGIPHCRSEAVTQATLVMARLHPPVDFGAKDGPADILFFIAAPAGADQAHLKLLSKLARSLMKKPFVASLREAETPERVVELVDDALGLGAPADAAPTADGAVAGSTAAATAVAGPNAVAQDNASRSAAPQGAGGPRRLVAVTACPTGIAHTYMAADSLKNTADDMGVELQVETQGSGGAARLDPAVIRNAEAVIFATDVDVRERSRFAGLPYIASAVKRGIDEPREMIDEALAAADNPDAKRVSGDQASASQTPDAAEGWGTRIRKAVMTGVSYMIPFVAAGGLLMALSFIIGDPIAVAEQADTILTTSSLGNLGDVSLGMYIAAVLFKIGNLSMSLLVPALAAYIAYGLADRPGIAPGFTVGLVANFMGAGFIGGIAGGLLAGLCAYWLTLPRLPRWLGSLMPVVIIPLLATLFAGGLMFFLIGGPIALFMEWLTSLLTGMTGASAIALGAVLGLMMCSDLGGPINKVAYSFAAAGLGAATVANTAPQEIMATVMAAGMVPPLGLALASTVLGRKYFTEQERENGKASWLLGASFISEGAIPFAAADPLRVLPASMLGGVVTGAMTMAFGVTSAAPHGGIWVFLVIGNFLGFIAAILAGTVVTAVTVIAFKHIGNARKRVAEATVSEPAPVNA